MGAEKAPAFQFYPKDFLMDGNVAGMTLAERGAYITLICLCWQEHSIPADLTRLARMVGEPPAVFRRIWPALRPCFRASPDRGRLVHPRLEREREKQEAFRLRQSAAGRASAAARLLPDGNHGSTAVQPDGNSPISDLRTAVQKEPPTPLHARGRTKRATRAELKHARSVLGLRFGQCRHDPTCENGDACLLAIVGEVRDRSAVAS